MNIADMRTVHSREAYEHAERALRRQGVRDRHPLLDRLCGVGRAGAARSSTTGPTSARTTSRWPTRCSSASGSTTPAAQAAPHARRHRVAPRRGDWRRGSPLLARPRARRLRARAGGAAPPRRSRPTPAADDSRGRRGARRSLPDRARAAAGATLRARARRPRAAPGRPRRPSSARRRVLGRHRPPRRLAARCIASERPQRAARLDPRAGGAARRAPTSRSTSTARARRLTLRRGGRAVLRRSRRRRPPGHRDADRAASRSPTSCGRAAPARPTAAARSRSRATRPSCPPAGRAATGWRSTARRTVETVGQARLARLHARLRRATSGG